MSTAGVIFPTGDFLSDGLPAPRTGRGAEPFLFSPEGEQIFNPSACQPRSTGVSGLNLVSGVGSLRTEGKHMLVLATPWRCGRREEFDNRSSGDQGQGNIQHCHHASDLAQVVPRPVFPFRPLYAAPRFVVTVHFSRNSCREQDNRSGKMFLGQRSVIC